MNKPIHTPGHQFLYDLATAISKGIPQDEILQKFNVSYEDLQLTQKNIIEAHRLFKEVCLTEREISSRKQYYRWNGQVFGREMKRECLEIDPDKPIHKSEEIRALVRMIVYKSNEEWPKEAKKIHDILHIEEDLPTSPMEPTADDLEAVEKGLANVHFDFDQELEDFPEHETDSESDDEDYFNDDMEDDRTDEDTLIDNEQFKDNLHHILHPDHVVADDDDDSSDFDINDFVDQVESDSGIAEKLGTEYSDSES